jgi:hypothetical protein
MTVLSTLLEKKMKARGLVAGQAAKKIGISYPTFRSALLGERVPNARCVGKFAKFLGISATAVVTAAGSKHPRGRAMSTGAVSGRQGLRAKRVVTSGRSGHANAAIIQKLTKILSKATEQFGALAAQSGAVVPVKRRARRVASVSTAKVRASARSTSTSRPTSAKVKLKRLSRKPRTKKATPLVVTSTEPVQKKAVKMKVKVKVKVKVGKKRRQRRFSATKTVPSTSSIPASPPALPSTEPTNPEPIVS